jgi:proteic killer suppression protein
VGAVERVGLEETRKVPGFHDEPLKGKLEGGRSIRLNYAYRAKAATVELVSVTGVDKHLYRK